MGDYTAMLPTERDDKPVVLLARQYEVTAEIDDDSGDMILRQERQHGDACDVIVISAANISSFLSVLLDLTPHRMFDMGGFPPPAAAGYQPADTHTAPAGPKRCHHRSLDPTNAERQRRYRERRRAVTDNGSNGSNGSASVTSDDKVDVEDA